MLTITIPPRTLYDEKTEQFTEFKGVVLQMEHSLVSLSKWESKFKKPFLKNDPPKTTEEIREYLKCMTITQNVDPIAYTLIDEKIAKEINDYIHDPQTATTFSNTMRGKGSSETLTSELIYYYMFACEIPIECQKWHLNRLLTLIRIFSIKNDPKGGKKLGKAETLSRYRNLNNMRKAKYGTKG